MDPETARQLFRICSFYLGLRIEPEEDDWPTTADCAAARKAQDQIEEATRTIFDSLEIIDKLYKRRNRLRAKASRSVMVVG
jgi:hypothetical protein